MVAILLQGGADKHKHKYGLETNSAEVSISGLYYWRTILNLLLLSLPTLIRISGPI